MANLTEHKLYGGDVRIFTPPSGHPYYHEDGSKILSVSDGLSVMDKQALTWWASGKCAEHIFDFWNIKREYTKIEKLELCKEAYKKFNDYKLEKAERGTKVHDYAERFVKGEKPLMPDNENIRNGALAFMKWWNETNLEAVMPEKIAYSKKIDIAGRTDLVAERKVSGKNVNHIVDYKAVSMYKKVKSFEVAEYNMDPVAWVNDRWKKYIPGANGFALDKDTKLKIKYPVFDGPIIQVSAYRAFLMEETGKHFGESYVIRFDQEFGDFDVTPISVELQDKAFETFKNLIAVRRYLNENGVKL